MPIDPLLIGGLIIVAIVVVIVMVRQRGDGVTTVKMPTTPPSLPATSLADDVVGEVHSLLARNQKIEAIKLVRQHTGLGLKEAKDYVDAIEHGLSPAAPAVQPAPPSLGQEDLAGQVRSLIARNQKIEAIKLVRQHTGLGLKEAKDYVEQLER